MLPPDHVQCQSDANATKLSTYITKRCTEVRDEAFLDESVEDDEDDVRRSETRLSPLGNAELSRLVAGVDPAVSG